MSEGGRARSPHEVTGARIVIIFAVGLELLSRAGAIEAEMVARMPMARFVATVAERAPLASPALPVPPLVSRSVSRPVTPPVPSPLPPPASLLGVHGAANVSAATGAAAGASGAAGGANGGASAGTGVAAAASADSAHDVANATATAVDAASELRGAGVATALKVNVGSVQAVATDKAMVQGAAATKQKLSPRSWFAITFSFAFVVKALCMTSNVIYQVSPIPQIRKFTEIGDTGDVDAAPFFCILYGCCQWCFYGMFAYVVTEKSGFLVLVYSNVVGACLGFYYIWGFHTNCRSKQYRAKLNFYYQVVCALVTVQVFTCLTMPRERALFFSGLVSSVCALLGAVSLMLPLPIVLETKCSATINADLLPIGTLSSCLWVLCGLLLHDQWIIIPNTFGLGVLLVTASLALYYPRDEQKAAVLRARDRIRRAMEDPASVSDLGSPIGRAALMLERATEYGTMQCEEPELACDTGGTC